MPLNYAPKRIYITEKTFNIRKYYQGRVFISFILISRKTKMCYITFNLRMISYGDKTSISTYSKTLHLNNIMLHGNEGENKKHLLQILGEEGSYYLAPEAYELIKRFMFSHRGPDSDSDLQILQKFTIEEK